MDKYTGYVVVVYAVTFLLLVGYLTWMWWRLRQVRDEGEQR
ncbi:heme exporter protein CcmD [Deinococcus sp. HSC-46F16]|nr:heme exporter protein CcmD [Deinococcus sp. HSC-46F16]